MRPSDEQFGHVIHYVIGLDIGDAVDPLRFIGGDFVNVFTVCDPLQHFRVIGFGDFHDFFKISAGAGGNDAVVA